MTAAESKECWDISIAELMEIFHDGLIALIPIADRARIRWREDTYDDWDNMASALFDSIVIASIVNGLPTESYSDVTLPGYDLLYNDHSAFSYIEVLPSGSPVCPHLVFHSYASLADKFDTVKVLEMAPTRRSLSHLQSVPVEGSSYRLQRRVSPSELVPITDVRVLL